MDSKLLGSNIAWLSRYELIHKTLELYYKEIKDNAHLEAALKEKLEEALKMQGDKVVYTHTSQEVKSKLIELGTLISKVLELTEGSETDSYKTLQRVFTEQYEITEDRVIVAKEKGSISAQRQNGGWPKTLDGKTQPVPYTKVWSEEFISVSYTHLQALLTPEHQLSVLMMN